MCRRARMPHFRASIQMTKFKDLVTGKKSACFIHSNNPLAAELESENDAARRGCCNKTFSELSSVEPETSGATRGLIQMINALTRATKLSACLALAAFMSTAPALSQAPTQ